MPIGKLTSIEKFKKNLKRIFSLLKNIFLRKNLIKNIFYENFYFFKKIKGEKRTMKE